VSELTAAFDAGDPARFHSVLERVLPWPEVPGDKCDPYVRVIITILRPPKFVRRCQWVYQRLSLEVGQELSRAAVEGAEADRMLEVLESLGLIKCEWVRQDSSEIIEFDKFVQGMCPPGTF
jgi:hypothetical protein